MARYYEIDGNLYPSATTVLEIVRKPQLEIWRGMVGNREADRIMEDTASLGRETHERCHAVVVGNDTDFQVKDQRVEPLVDAFTDWFRAAVKEVILAEEPTWSLKYGYAGTPDLICILKGDQANPTVVDIKTTGAIWKDQALQLAAYQGALREHGINPWRRMVVHLNKANPLRPATIKEFHEHENDFNHYLYALSLYKYFEEVSLNEHSIIKLSTGRHSASAGKAVGQ